MNSTLGRKLGPLAALTVVALIGAGCSDAPAGNTNADYENGVKFAEW